MQLELLQAVENSQSSAQAAFKPEYVYSTACGYVFVCVQVGHMRVLGVTVCVWDFGPRRVCSGCACLRMLHQPKLLSRALHEHAVHLSVAALRIYLHRASVMCSNSQRASQQNDKARWHLSCPASSYGCLCMRQYSLHR
jgi:hypothetical protein